MVPWQLVSVAIAVSLLMQGCSEEESSGSSRPMTRFLKYEYARTYWSSISLERRPTCEDPFPDKENESYDQFDEIWAVGDCQLVNNQSVLSDVTDGQGRRRFFDDTRCALLWNELGATLGPTELGEVNCSWTQDGWGFLTRWRFIEVFAPSVRLRGYASSACDESGVVRGRIASCGSLREVCDLVQSHPSRGLRIRDAVRLCHGALVHCIEGEASLTIHENATCDDAGARPADMKDFVLIPQSHFYGLDGATTSTCTRNSFQGHWLAPNPVDGYYKVDC